jgi:hypothetical protein
VEAWKCSCATVCLHKTSRSKLAFGHCRHSTVATTTALAILHRGCALWIHAKGNLPTVFGKPNPGGYRMQVNTTHCTAGAALRHRAHPCNTSCMQKCWGWLRRYTFLHTATGCCNHKGFGQWQQVRLCAQPHHRHQKGAAQWVQHMLCNMQDHSLVGWPTTERTPQHLPPMQPTKFCFISSVYLVAHTEPTAWMLFASAHASPQYSWGWAACASSSPCRLDAQQTCVGTSRSTLVAPTLAAHLGVASGGVTTVLSSELLLAGLATLGGALRVATNGAAHGLALLAW